MVKDVKTSLHAPYLPRIIINNQCVEFTTMADNTFTDEDLDGIFDSSDPVNTVPNEGATIDDAEFLDWLDNDEEDGNADAAPAVLIGDDGEDDLDFEKDILGENDGAKKERDTGLDDEIKTVPQAEGGGGEEQVVAAVKEELKECQGESQKEDKAAALTVEQVGDGMRESEDDLEVNTLQKQQKDDSATPSSSSSVVMVEIETAAPISASDVTFTSISTENADGNDLVNATGSSVTNVSGAGGAQVEAALLSNSPDDNLSGLPSAVAVPQVKDSTSTKHVPMQFSDMIRSAHKNKGLGATLMEIKEACRSINYKINQEDRPYLWTKLLCGRTLDAVIDSSMTESYIAFGDSFYANGGLEVFDEITRAEFDSMVESILKLKKDFDKESITFDLSCLFGYYHQSWVGDKNLYLRISATIIGAGVASPVHSIVMRHILPSFIPLMGLENSQRILAMKHVHKKFYLLACYHLPLLIQHLDKFAPGWFWVRTQSSNESELDNEATKIGRNLEAFGEIPLFWFGSSFGGSSMDIDRLILLWDVLLCSNRTSLKFFLGLALLEKYSDTLLLTKGPELRNTLNEMVNLQIDSEDDDKISDQDYIKDWIERAEGLIDLTPTSILDQMDVVEDEAISSNNVLQQERVERSRQEMLKREADERRASKLKEELRKSEEKNDAINRSRLQKYYQKYNPDKVHTVPKILEHYKGRLPLLEKNLKSKYGEGFDPILPSTGIIYAISESGKNFKASFQSLALHAGVNEEKSALLESGGVSFQLSVNEVMPSLFSRSSGKGRDSIKFLLVDARQPNKASLHGRFPTAIRVNPDMLMDPDSLREVMEMFETLRGSVHICIMVRFYERRVSRSFFFLISFIYQGEGISSMPDLYGAQLDEKATDSATKDHANVNLCALLMLKKGFPFVSVLDGGFASAHSWLYREGPSNSLNLQNILIDYSRNSWWYKLEESFAEKCEHQSVVDMEGKSAVMHAMKVEIAQRNILSAIKKLTRDDNELLAMDFSSIFSKKGAEEVELQNDIPENCSSPEHSDMDNTSQSSTKFKKVFTDRFSFRIKKGTKAPAPGSLTDSSSYESASDEDTKRTLPSDEINLVTSQRVEGEKKKSIFGFRKKKEDSDATLSKFKSDVFKKNPFGSFNKKRWSRVSSPTSELDKSDSEEISFENIPADDVIAFDIGNLSDED